MQIVCFPVLTIVVAIFFAVPVSPALADNFARISTEDQFRSQVVGKRLFFGEDYFTIKSNRTLTGKFGGERLKGAWEWRDGFWCRTLTTHSKNTDCQLWTVSGKAYKVTRERGKGRSFSYTTK